ncbi:MAG: hypothetical protein WC087_04115 [Candidatus Paceibacterota bacterium]
MIPVTVLEASNNAIDCKRLVNILQNFEKDVNIFLMKKAPLEKGAVVIVKLLILPKNIPFLNQYHQIICDELQRKARDAGWHKVSTHYNDGTIPHPHSLIPYDPEVKIVITFRNSK